jgi:glyceraldehyde 3-phosphate dehydrogenase
LLLNHPIEVVAINDLPIQKTMAHLLKYDSIHVLTYKVSADEKEFL